MPRNTGTTMDEPTAEQREQWDLAQIKQRRSRLGAKPIGGIVRRWMSDTGYGETQANEGLCAAWLRAVGPELDRCSRVGTLSRGALLVQVDNSAVAQELHFRKRQILARLATELASDTISDLKIRVG